MSLPPGVRTLLTLAILTVAATSAAIGLIIEVPRRHPFSIQKGRHYE